MTADTTVTRIEFARRAGITAAGVTAACRGPLAPACVGKRIDPGHPAAVQYLEKRARKQASKMEKAGKALTFPSEEQEQKRAALIDKTPDPLLELARRECEAQRKFGIKFIEKRLKVGTRRAQLIKAQLDAGLEGPSNPPPIPEGKRPNGGAARRERLEAQAMDRLASPEPPPAAELPDSIAEFADWTLRDILTRFGEQARFSDWLGAMLKMEQITDRRLRNADRMNELVSREMVKHGVIDVFDSTHRRMMTDGARSIAVSVAAKVKAGVENAELEKEVSEVLSSFIRSAKKQVEKYVRAVR